MGFYSPRCLAGDSGASDGFPDVNSRRARGSGSPSGVGSCHHHRHCPARCSLLRSVPRDAPEGSHRARYLSAQNFFKKRLAEHSPVRIMRDLGGGSPPAKDLPERQVC